MRVLNQYTAPLGLPGPSIALGGPGELAVGANDIDDGAWMKAKESQQVQAWLKSEPPLVVECPVESPKKSKG